MPITHIAGNIVIGVVCFAVGWLLSTHRKIGAYVALALAAGMFLSHYLINSRPDIYFKLLRSPNLVFYTNLFPFSVSLALPAIWAFSRKRRQKIRVAILAIALIGLSLWDYRFYTLPEAQTWGTHINKDGICIQSSNDTCSAAAAVTLLHLYGIQTTEGQIAQIAVTKQGRGTRHLGLVRALIQLTRDIPTAQVTISHTTVDDLMNHGKPAIIRVGVPHRMPLPIHQDLVRLYDWTPGVLHDVVFLGIDPDRPGYVLIGEPQFGLERWPVEHLKALFQNMSVQIEMPMESILVRVAGRDVFV